MAFNTSLDDTIGLGLERDRSVRGPAMGLRRVLELLGIVGVEGEHTCPSGIVGRREIRRWPVLAGLRVGSVETSSNVIEDVAILGSFLAQATTLH